MTAEQLLTINCLNVAFHLPDSVIHAVDDIDMAINRGEAHGLVGESGSGKTVTALSIMKLVPSPPARISGEITFNGENLLQKTEDEISAIRGAKIAMIYQDPTSSLNPVQRVGDQLAEAILTHQRIPKTEAFRTAVKLMDDMGIPSPEKRSKDYPHLLSGGMRQRIVIAMALACNPDLVIADEPTTMLDLITQSQILELMKERVKGRASILYITHDLGLVAELCNRVTVMYAGKIMESGSVYQIFENPLHPYTKGLLESVPRVDDVGLLRTMPGTLPDPANPPVGCRFHPRCPYARDNCKKEKSTFEAEPGHWVACELRW